MQPFRHPDFNQLDQNAMKKDQMRMKTDRMRELYKLQNDLANDTRGIWSPTTRRIAALSNDTIGELSKLEDERSQAMVKDAANGLGYLDMGRPDLFEQLYVNRYEMLKDMPGANADQTGFVMSVFNDEAKAGSTDFPETRKILKTMSRMGKAGIDKPVRKSEIMSDGTAILLYDDGVQVIGPDGAALTGQAAAMQFKEIRKAEQERRQAIAELEIETAKQKARVDQVVAQEGADMSSGLTAAETMPFMKRAYELLDTVETGGIDRAMLMAKKYFGIDQADPGQLYNLLEKQIVKQLRDTFGAQFTVAEANWLKSIEANFGNDTATNRRLLEQGMMLLQQRIDLGKSAANAAGNSRIIESMDAWLSMELPGKETEIEMPGSKVKMPVRSDFDSEEEYIDALIAWGNR